MAYELISCANNQATAGIRINVTWDGRDFSNVTTFQLRRSFAGETAYKVLYTGNINFSSDLTYEYDDIEAIAGVSYTYDACVLNANNWRAGGARATITCAFDGIMIADEFGSWHSAFGTSDSTFNLSASKNRPVNYIVTLAGKYPHRVSNAQANYWTGSCSALWLPFGTRCDEPVIEGADEHRLAFIEWLCSDTEKLLKTGDGKAMIVSIDTDIRENYHPQSGLTTVQFNWTQIGEVARPALSATMGKAWVTE